MIDDMENVLEGVAKMGINVLKYGKTSEKFNYALSWDDITKYIRKELNENS